MAIRPATHFLALSAVGLVLSGAAVASPMDDPGASGGVLFAGPTRPHGSSVLVNPAALGIASRGQHLLIQSSLRVSQLWIDRTQIEPNGSVSPGASVTDATPVPGGMIAYDVAVSEIARLGFAIYTPIAERFVSKREDLRYHSLGGHLYQYTASTVASFRLADRFHLGIGLSLGYTSFNLSFAADSAMNAGSNPERGTLSDCGGSPCGFENPQADQRYSYKTETGLSGLFQGKNIGLSVGGLLRIKDNWWFGASIITLPGAGLLGGDLDLRGTVNVTEAPRDGAARLSGDAEILMRTTQLFYFGARGPISRGFDIVATMRWANWSRHDRINLQAFGGDLPTANGEIPEAESRFRGLRDSLSLDVGLESAGSEIFRYGARVRVENGAVDDDRMTPIQADSFNATALVGGDLRVGNHVVLGTTYGLTWFPPVDADNSAFSPIARVDCIDQDFAFEACGDLRRGSALPTAGGRYRQLQHSLILSVKYETL